MIFQITEHGPGEKGTITADTIIFLLTVSLPLQIYAAFSASHLI